MRVEAARRMTCGGGGGGSEVQACQDALMEARRVQPGLLLLLGQEMLDDTLSFSTTLS